MSYQRWISKNLFWILGRDSLLFNVAGEPIKLPLNANDPENIRNLETKVPWQRLEELWAEGSLKPVDAATWSLSYEELFLLPEEYFTDLKIPFPSNLNLTVRSAGIPGREGFGLDIEIRHPDKGRLEQVVARIGPFYLLTEDEVVLVPKSVFDLLQLKKTGPAGDQISDHYEFLGRAQVLARKSGAHLEGILESDSYYFPDEVDLDLIEHDSDHIELVPSFKDKSIPQVTSNQLLSERLGTYHTVRGRGRQRKRFVFNPEMKETLKELGQTRNITGQDVPRFIENPEMFLPAQIDLSQFSARVKGIKTVVYNSRPYIHVQRTQGGWFTGIPGVRIEKIAEGGETPGGTEDETGQDREIDVDEYTNLVHQAQEQGDEYVKLNGNWIKINDVEAREFGGVLNKYDVEGQKELRFPANAILDIFENLQALEFDLPPQEQNNQPFDGTSLPEIDPPGSFTGILRPHQKLGYRWMAHLQHTETGGLLADDMGLGKTIQVLVHLARLHEENCLKPSLIICPKTLIDNWLKEIQNFFPSCPSVINLGSRRMSADILTQFDLVLASYDAVRRNQMEIGKVDWQTVVADEAQYIKNPTAQRTSALKAAKSKHRVALTGTPVENGMIEFWSIMDFVRPGLLGSWSSFRKEYEKPLAEAGDGEERDSIVKKLLDKLGFHYLRRMKEDELPDLPEKQVHEIKVQLSESQMSLYKEIAISGLRGGRGSALAAITQLLMICCHPDALSDSPLLTRYEQGISPKLDKVMGIIGEVQNAGEKVVIFTRFKKIQKILQFAVYETFGILPPVINGDVNDNRQQIIDIFSGSPGFNVLILSHDVGGVGLNITAANHVIHFTRPWNPAKESQATDRVHRIGQDRQVHVYLPITSHESFTTVEQRLAELVESKRSLAEDVLRPSREISVSADELIESLEDAAGIIPEEIAAGEDVIDVPRIEIEEEPEQVIHEAVPEAVSQGPLQIEPAEEIETGEELKQDILDIEEGEIGHSYESLFLPYIEKAAWMQLEDPYIRMNYQFRNFSQFCSIIKSKTEIREFILVTKVEDESAKQDAIQILDEHKEDFRVAGINFSYKFSPVIHARSIKIDTGWHIGLDRGLDIFQKPDTGYGISYAPQTELKCKQTRISYIRTG